MANNEAMVTEELINAYRHFPLFNWRGILAIDKKHDKRQNKIHRTASYFITEVRNI